jgi:hypothetical protein
VTNIHHFLIVADRQIFLRNEWNNQSKRGGGEFRIKNIIVLAVLDLKQPDV